MTTAPPNLLAVRKLLLAHLDVDPDKARSIDLESAEVGIVGDTAHVSQGNSYHLGLPEQSRTGYAATESPRDTKGLCGYASALDVGMFTVTTAKGTYDLRHFSAWCVGQCKAGAADARDIREIIWSPDGKVVKRWDDLGKRSSGDNSHLIHTHFSFYRDATKAGRDLTPLFRRYLTSIGLVEDDMTPDDLLKAQVPNPITGKTASVATFLQSINGGVYWSRKALDAGLAAILGAVKGLNTDAILAEMRRIEQADTARDAELADLIQKANSGELAAEAFVRKVSELFAAGAGPQAG